MLGAHAALECCTGGASDSNVAFCNFSRPQGKLYRIPVASLLSLTLALGALGSEAPMLALGLLRLIVIARASTRSLDAFSRCDWGNGLRSTVGCAGPCPGTRLCSSQGCWRWRLHCFQQCHGILVPCLVGHKFRLTVVVRSLP